MLNKWIGHTLKNPWTPPTFLYLGLKIATTCGQSNSQTLNAATIVWSWMDTAIKQVTGPLKLWPCGISSKETTERAENGDFLYLHSWKLLLTSCSPSEAYDISKHQPCKEVENLQALSARMPLTANHENYPAQTGFNIWKWDFLGDPVVKTPSFPMLCGSLDWRRACGENGYMCMYSESLCCSPETITTLFVNWIYTDTK